jgi:chromosome segregation ATPase
MIFGALSNDGAGGARESLPDDKIPGGMMNKFPTEEDKEDELPLEREIRVDEEDPDLSYRGEIRSLEQDSQIEKLNQRISLILVLVPCLLGAILLFAYFDLKNRLSQVQDMGSTERKALSEDVVDKVGAVSQQYKTLETSIVDRVAGLEKSAGSIAKDLKRDKQEIKKLTASKVDKKALERALKEQSAEAAKTLSLLQNALEEQKRAVQSLKESSNKDVGEMLQAIEKIRDDARKIESAIQNLSKRKIDERGLEKLLETQRKSYEVTTSLLQKKITSLEKAVLELQKQLSIAPVPEAPSIPTDKKPAAKAPEDTLLPAPAKIIEQEIPE